MSSRSRIPVSSSASASAPKSQAWDGQRDVFYTVMHNNVTVAQFIRRSSGGVPALVHNALNHVRSFHGMREIKELAQFENVDVIEFPGTDESYVKYVINGFSYIITVGSVNEDGTKVGGCKMCGVLSSHVPGCINSSSRGSSAVNLRNLFGK